MKRLLAILQIKWPEGTTILWDNFTGENEPRNEDVTWAILPNGIGIDIGWHPDFVDDQPDWHSTGSYTVCVVKADAESDDWDNPLEMIKAVGREVAVLETQRLADKWSTGGSV